MTGPPAERPEAQEARGAGPWGREKTRRANPNYVRVVNPIWNGPGVVDRKKAARYVKEGRATWVASDQIQLVTAHSLNIAAKEAIAAAAERAITKNSENDRTRMVWRPGISGGATVMLGIRGLSGVKAI